MKLFDSMEEFDYEQLVFCQDKASRLKAIICIHDTTLGPALGGTRMWPYETEEAAVIDVLRLSRGMTYKNAAAGLNFGGGKTVIIGDPLKDKSEALLRALGRFIESLNGRYITGEDVGICVEDLEFIKLETSHVKGTGAFDPSPFTGYGVWQGIRACAAEIWGQDDLTEKTVAIQGLGHVGYCLAKHLHEAGAKLIVADINEACMRCPIGAEHVAQFRVKAAHRDINTTSLSPLRLHVKCVRCERTTHRRVGPALCVSCFNRQLEIHHGLNARNSRPVGRHMNADLVGAPGFKLGFDQHKRAVVVA